MDNPTHKRALTLAGLICGSLLTATTCLAGHTNPVLKANLEGSAMVGSEGDRDGTGTGYVFGVDGDPTTLCYVIVVSEIEMVPVKEGMAAHIHEARQGENGDVVANLAGPEDGNAGDCLTEGEKGKFPTGESGIVQRILQNPEEFYINVHNPDFEKGAIRGQLMETHGHSHEM
ncbi:CHRD domain-containing protein [Marinobacter nanhaiticus D15-8W]|uniref:CHRD domain-containing protein n=1 Tax=Marinobacter nanhaiticus D15-8W TaxID=626887 RepID=N6X055_9GAMM|nr:CHRD domain-containing protein [Marinobacter nanhaiticus]ENO14433.2 CHRD domain-containing protein [Marinobacter nanhaiticus D15-8W]